VTPVADATAASGIEKKLAAAPAPARKRGMATKNPIRHVHFSSFIIQ
jgi:hypothetical protein